MTEKLYLDCLSGISGDMFVAAMIDLGADLKMLEKALRSIPDEGFHTEIRRVKKSGIDCCDFNVVLDDLHENHDHDMEYLYGHDDSHCHGEEHDHCHCHEEEHDHCHCHEEEHDHGLVHHQTNGKKMTEQIRAALGDGAELRDVTAAEPFYIEADSPPFWPASTPTTK